MLAYYAAYLSTKLWAGLILPEKNNELNIHIMDNMSWENSFVQHQICSYHFKNSNI